VVEDCCHSAAGSCSCNCSYCCFTSIEQGHRKRLYGLFI